MGKALAMFACSLGACVMLANGPPSKPAAAGASVVRNDAHDKEIPIAMIALLSAPNRFLNIPYNGAVCTGFTRLDLAEASRRPPKVELFRVTSEAHHVVYICDRSGSLATTFQIIQNELLRSISYLHPRQDFIILMMADDRSIDLDPNGLVPANMDNRLKAVEFMRDVTASGGTTLLPSLKRAFEVLRAADKNKPGKVIYILSDGDFAGMSPASSYTARNGKELSGNDAVIQWLRDRNADKGIQVHPILLFNKDKYATEVYKQIAAENAGQFHRVSEDD